MCPAIKEPRCLGIGHYCISTVGRRAQFRSSVIQTIQVCGQRNPGAEMDQDLTIEERQREGVCSLSHNLVRNQPRGFRLAYFGARPGALKVTLEDQGHPSVAELEPGGMRAASPTLPTDGTRSCPCHSRQVAPRRGRLLWVRFFWVRSPLGWEPRGGCGGWTNGRRAGLSFVRGFARRGPRLARVPLPAHCLRGAGLSLRPGGARLSLPPGGWGGRGRGGRGPPSPAADPGLSLPEPRRSPSFGASASNPSAAPSLPLLAPAPPPPSSPCSPRSAPRRPGGLPRRGGAARRGSPRLCSACLGGAGKGEESCQAAQHFQRAAGERAARREGGGLAPARPERSLLFPGRSLHAGTVTAAGGEDGGAGGGGE